MIEYVTMTRAMELTGVSSRGQFHGWLRKGNVRWAIRGKNSTGQDVWLIPMLSCSKQRRPHVCVDAGRSRVYKEHEKSDN